MIFHIGLFRCYHLYLRAVLVTLYSLIILRFNNALHFWQLAAHDLVIMILLIVLLGEGVIYEDVFFPSLISCLIVIFLHQGMNHISPRSN